MKKNEAVYLTLSNTFFKDVTHEENDGIKLNAGDIRLLMSIMANKQGFKTHLSQVADELGIHRNTAQNRAKKLVQLGYLKFVLGENPKDRNQGHWLITFKAEKYLNGKDYRMFYKSFLMEQELSDNEFLVLAYCLTLRKSNWVVTTKRVADNLNMLPKTTHGILSRLYDKGFITKIINDDNTVEWIVEDESYNFIKITPDYWELSNKEITPKEPKIVTPKKTNKIIGPTTKKRITTVPVMEGIEFDIAAIQERINRQKGRMV